MHFPRSLVAAAVDRVSFRLTNRNFQAHFPRYIYLRYDTKLNQRGTTFITVNPISRNAANGLSL